LAAAALYQASWDLAVLAAAAAPECLPCAIGLGAASLVTAGAAALLQALGFDFGSKPWINPKRYHPIDNPQFGLMDARAEALSSQTALVDVGSPTGGTEPPGHSITRYGCWCGAGWSGCKEIPHDQPLSKTDKTLRTAIDTLDRCCETHDFCYSDCIEKFGHTSAAEVCQRTCDEGLLANIYADRVAIKHEGAEQFAIAIQAAMEIHVGTPPF
jgi:hypothetical protein